MNVTAKDIRDLAEAYNTLYGADDSVVIDLTSERLKVLNALNETIDKYRAQLKEETNEL